MNTKILWIVVIALIIIGGGWYALSAKKAAAPTEETAVTTEPAPTQEVAADADYVALVTLTDSGFTPASVTVSAGDTVRFRNDSSRGMWVGSDEHPTHTDYDGTSTREHCAEGANTTGTFDQCASSNAGTTWDYTFTKSGSFGYHNHVGASSKGTIVVN